MGNGLDVGKAHREESAFERMKIPKQHGDLVAGPLRIAPIRKQMLDRVEMLLCLRRELIPQVVVGRAHLALAPASDSDHATNRSAIPSIERISHPDAAAKAAWGIAVHDAGRRLLDEHRHAFAAQGSGAFGAVLAHAGQHDTDRGRTDESCRFEQCIGGRMNIRVDFDQAQLITVRPMWRDHAIAASGHEGDGMCCEQ